MDWFLYDNGLRHERVIRAILIELFSWDSLGIFQGFCVFIYCFKASIDVFSVLLNFCDEVYLRKLLAAKNTCCYYLCGIPRIE